jgi:hypothetical protein
MLNLWLNLLLKPYWIRFLPSFNEPYGTSITKLEKQF